MLLDRTDDGPVQVRRNLVVVHLGRRDDGSGQGARELEAGALRCAGDLGGFGGEIGKEVHQLRGGGFVAGRRHD